MGSVPSGVSEMLGKGLSRIMLIPPCPAAPSWEEKGEELPDTDRICCVVVLRGTEKDHKSLF